MTKRPSASKEPGSSAPVYWRIEHDLRSRIRAGQWPVGGMLPSRQRLAQEYGVALNTVQKAIARLLEDGTLRADDRRGTFVAHGAMSPRQELQPGSLTVQPTSLLAPPRTPNVVATTLGILTISGIKYQGTVQPVVPSNALHPVVIRALERAFAAAGGSTRFYDLIQPPGEPSLSPAGAIRLLLDQGIEALVIIDLHGHQWLLEDIAHIAPTLPMPLVFISWADIPYPISHIYYDNSYAGYQAVEHLLKAGYSRPVFLTPFTADWLDERIAGARMAIQHLGLGQELRIYPTDPTINARVVLDGTIARRATEEGIAAGLFFPQGLPDRQQPVGIIAPNDEAAWGALEAFTEAGFVPGQDFGLVGFDDFGYSRTLGLTSLRPPLEALGEEAARLVIGALHGEEMRMQVRLRSHLIPRASTSRR